MPATPEQIAELVAGFRQLDDHFRAVAALAERCRVSWRMLIGHTDTWARQPHLIEEVNEELDRVLIEMLRNLSTAKSSIDLFDERLTTQEASTHGPDSGNH